MEVHKCHLDSAVPQGSQIRVSAHKYFRLDGTIYSTAVSAELSGSGFFRPHSTGPHIYARLDWPGQPASIQQDRVTSFDWSKGSISISASLAGSSGSARRNEEWQQVVLERDRSSILIHNQGDVSTLFLSPLESHFVSDLGPAGAQFWLNSSLERLRAWSSGSGILTAYNVLVTRRRPRANSYPTDPAGQRRIVFAYDIDVAALDRTVSEIRSSFEQWERGLSDGWRECPRGQEGGEIVVTDAKISSPASRNSRSPRALPGRR